MSNVSDERLVIAAVKGENRAIEELKERALSRIRTTLGQRLKFEVDTKYLERLEQQIVEGVFNNLHQYTFKSPFLSWVHRITFNVAIAENRKHNNVVATDVVKSDTGVKDPPQTEVPIDYEAIDYEIRPLVNLLNRSPYIQIGAEIVFRICELKGIEIVIINKGEQPSFEEELTRDVMEIMTVFCAKLYGRRSHKSKKMAEEIENIVNEEKQRLELTFGTPTTENSTQSE